MVAQFGTNKIKDVSFTKAWYSTGAHRDIWEVEGDVAVKKGWFDKEYLHFKFQRSQIGQFYASKLAKV